MTTGSYSPICLSGGLLLAKNYYPVQHENNRTQHLGSFHDPSDHKKTIKVKDFSNGGFRMGQREMVQVLMIVYIIFRLISQYKHLEKRKITDYQEVKHV